MLIVVTVEESMHINKRLYQELRVIQCENQLSMELSKKLEPFKYQKTK